MREIKMFSPSTEKKFTFGGRNNLIEIILSWGQGLNPANLDIKIQRMKDIWLFPQAWNLL